MGVYLYDNALLDKIKNWTSSTNITITGINNTNQMLDVVEDMTNDTPIQLPMIQISRNGGYDILNKQKKPLSYNALAIGKKGTKKLVLNAIPISVTYQIDIYTRYLQEADEYMRNLVFNIINYPCLSILVPYESTKFKHESTIHLISDVQDNSDIPERKIPGQFTRLSVSISVDDAYIWDVRKFDTYKIVEIDLQTEKDMPRELILDLKNRQ